jgi:hypothetical protein
VADTEGVSGGKNIFDFAPERCDASWSRSKAPGMFSEYGK